MRKEITEWIISIVVAVALVLLIINFVAKPYTVKGDSMDPTLKDGERVIVNLFGYKFGDILNDKLLVAEILTTLICMIGVILTVPITSFLVYRKKK